MNNNYMVNRKNLNKKNLLNWKIKSKEEVEEQFNNLDIKLKDKNINSAFNILQNLFDENINEYFKDLIIKFINNHSNEEINIYVNRWKQKYIQSKGLINFSVLIGIDLIK